MPQDADAYLVVNFGGPRSLEEIYPFLTSLLTDAEVVRTKLPYCLHRYFFKKIAKRRAKRIEGDYLKMGGSSPIFGDTEAVKELLEKILKKTVITYHRYLPITHKATFDCLERLEAERIIVFPMFPQFSYATTGSIAKQLTYHLTTKTVQKLSWIRSYADHPDFISLFAKRIKETLTRKNMNEEKTILLFSAHGLPQSFVEEGDPYLIECQYSFSAISALFPRLLCRLAFQSKFGPGVWLQPSTEDLCKNIYSWCQQREHVVIVPLSFTSDHIETLVEIEDQYIPLITQQGLTAERLEAFNRGEDWINVIKNIILHSMTTTTKMCQRS
jgi:ferrochelatase